MGLRVCSRTNNFEQHEAVSQKFGVVKVLVQPEQNFGLALRLVILKCPYQGYYVAIVLTNTSKTRCTCKHRISIHDLVKSFLLTFFGTKTLQKDACLPPQNELAKRLRVYPRSQPSFLKPQINMLNLSLPKPMKFCVECISLIVKFVIFMDKFLG